MRIHRADPLIHEAIEALDQRLLQAKRAIPKSTPEEQRALAWNFLSPPELAFVQGEIARCANDRVFYLNNYHVIQPESGILTCMSPLYDLQLIVEETLQDRIASEGQAYLVILKPRQSGITEYSNGVMCWRTFFLPNAYTLTVAQEPKTSGWVQRKVNVAYDHLPWWMRPERQYHNRGEYLEFGRKDEGMRSVDPGLGTILVTAHALQESGIAIGKTIRSLHMTEISRWPSSDLYVSDIKPTMHAPDTIAIAESTAWGSNGFFYNLWQGANDPEDDDSDWTPLFLPAYRDGKNRRRIRPSQQPFVLTPVEEKIQSRVLAEEGYSIPAEFWNFRRRGIKDSVKESGFPYGHLECYPVSPREAFQSSGHSAFARHKLDEQEANVRRALWTGEILFDGRGRAPKLLLNAMTDGHGRYLDLPYSAAARTTTNRFHLWEQPDPAAIYYIAADAGEGIGQDLSVVEVLRAGYLNEPDVQVAEWVGYEPPEAFGRILYAIGHFFNRSEIAVEYNGPGRATADYLTNQLEYPSLYVPRRTDRFKGQFASYFHWQTTGKTKPLLRNKFNETLLENGIVIQSEYTLSELRACESTGEGFEAMEGHDDAAMAMTICLYCLRQTAPDLRRSSTDPAAPSASMAAAARGLHPPVGAVIYGVFDQLFRMRGQKRSLTEAEELVAANPGWQIRPIPVSKANTAFSVIHHQRGLENELYQSGVADREISPALVTEYAAATGRLEGMYRGPQPAPGQSAPAPGQPSPAPAPAGPAPNWNSMLGELGGGELTEWSEML